MMLFPDMLSLNDAIDIRIGEAGDEAICESHKCLQLIPEDGSLFDFFSSEL